MANIPFLNNTSFSAAVTVASTLTVGGDVTIDASLDIIRNSNNNQLKLKRNGSATGEFDIFTNTNTLFFKNIATGQTPLGIDGSNNATFAGDITLADDLNFTTNGFADISNTGTGAMRFKPSSQTLALTLTGANATFAGDVIIDDGVGRITLSSVSGENRIQSTTTGFGAYEKLAFTADDYEFKLGNATFAGNVNPSGSIRINGGSDQGSQLCLFADSNGHTSLAGFDFEINTGGNNSRSRSFFINSSGAATFTGNVTTGASLISTNAIVDNVVAKTANGSLTFKTNGGSTIAQFFNDLSATFTGLVSGITPVASNNFVTKAYADGLTPGAGVFLPLAGGTMTGTNGVKFPDGFQLQLGTGNDGQIFHNDASMFVTNNKGDLVIKNNANDKDIVFQSDNGSGGLSTYFQLDGSAADGTYTYTVWGDNDVITVGSGFDMQIYHDGNNSYIRDLGQGDLLIDSNGTSLKLRVNSTENALEAVSNGSVFLFHNGIEKFATTSAGVTITGKTTSTNDLILSQTGPRIDFDNGSAGSLRLFSVSQNTAAMTLTSAGNADFAGTIESGGSIFPTTNGGGLLGLGNKQFSGLNLSSSSSITWANGDASILEGEVGGYSLSFNVYNGVAALERVLLLEKSKAATFSGNVTVNGTSSLVGNVGIGIAPQASRKLSIQNVNADNELEFYGTDFTNIYSRTASGMAIEVIGSGYIKLGAVGGSLTIANSGAATFTGLVSGVTPTAAANFATKAYVDVHDGGAGVYLPLAGGIMTGDIQMQDELINFYTSGSTTLPQFRGLRDNTALNSRTWGTEGGWAYTTFNSTTSNAPSSGLHNANGLLTFNTHSGDYLAQIAMTTNTGKLWQRSRNGGGWLTWYQIYSTQDFSTTDISNWNTAYANMVTAVAVTGTTTKTITLTQQDGGTVSNTFTAGVVQTVTTGNSNTITIGGSTANPIVQASTAAVNASSANLATGAQIQTAINTALTGVLQFEGTWNASTNTPTLSSGSGTSGDYYIVSVAGNTNLDGITDWQIGDWAVFANTTWTKIDNSQIGNVTGTGSSGRVAFWSSDTNITNDVDFAFDGTDLSLGSQAGTTGARLLLYGTVANNGPSTIKTTNGNLHIDSDNGHTVYLNYYTGGTTSVIIGTGAGGTSGTEFYASGDVAIGDELTITTIANATTDTDKFLVSDGGKVKYRTGAQLRSDIGAGTGSGNVTGSGAAGRVALWSSSNNISEDVDLRFDSTYNTLYSPGLLTANSRITTSKHYPTGHYTPGETVWEIDPTWNTKQLQEYFGSSNVSWDTTSIAQDAPGGYAIYINGGVNVGGVYSSGFPYIPIDNDGVYYMECYIKNVGEMGHYMGSNEFNATFANVGGNPGSYGYWVMSNTNPGTSWTKVSGYIGGFDSSQTGKFELAAKYWTPQALFNYTNTSGTRACYISGWKAVRVDAPGNRYFDNNVNIGLNSLPTTRLQVSSSGANGIDISKDTGSTTQSGRLFFSTDTTTEGVALMNANGTFQIRTGANPQATSGTTRFSIDSTGASFTGTLGVTGRITASGGINGLTLANGGISGSNYDISGVNQLKIADPGEGIVFGGGAGGDIILALIDDASDNILNLNAAAAFKVNAKITNLTNPTAAQDAATKAYVDGATTGDSTIVRTSGNQTIGGTKTFSTAPIFQQDASSRTMYIDGAGNIIQFRNAASANKWELVGRDGQFYVYKNDGTGSGYKWQIDGSGNHNFTGVVTLNSGSLTLGGTTSNISLNGTGRIQGIDTVTSGTDAANKNYVDTAVAGVPGESYINAATFATGTGIITGTGVGSAGFTVDIDGRYPIGNTANQPFYIDLQQNPVGTTYGQGVATVPTYYFGQRAGDNDGMRFYTESAASNDVTAVWEIIDDIETGLTWLFRNKKTYSPYTATDAMKIFGDGDVTVGKDLTVTGNLIAGTGDISMDGSSSGQVKINGAGYSGAIALDATAMRIYHNSSSRDLVLGTNETARLTIGGSGNIQIANSLGITGNLTVTGGDVILGGTGRIQGVDTVSASTDAANKAYVDSATAGAMTGFGVSNLVSGTGSTFTITNGQTVGIIGGTNIQSVVSTANETITLNYTGPTGTVTGVTTTAPVTVTQNGGGSQPNIAITSPGNGDWFNGGVPRVGSDGLMEIGRYVDFHNTNAATTDFDVRLDCYSAGNLRLTGSLNISSDLVVNSQIGAGITPASGITIQAEGKIRSSDDTSGDYFDMYCDGSNTGDSFLENTNGRIVIKSEIGTTAIDAPGAAATLDILNASNSATIRLKSSGDSYIAGGDLGIGNTAPTSGIKLDVTGNVLFKNSNGVSDLYLGNYATANHFRFHTNNADTYFDMNCGNVYWRDGGSIRYRFFPATANMTVNGTITQNSDIRIKENIIEIDDCISKVQAMRGVYYNRTDFNTEVTKVGVIAQEVEAVLPELILENEDDGFKSVAYSELTAVLINAIKEQQQIIEDLKTRVEQLEK